MKKSIYLIISLILMSVAILTFAFLVQGCGWSKKDQGLFATFILLNVADGVITYDLLDDPDMKELNPLITGKTSLIVVKGVGNIVVYYLADISPRYRTWLLTAGAIVLGGCVIWNLTL